MLASTIREVKAFLASQSEVLRITGEFKAVVKPCDGGGSEGVSVCSSEEEVIETFASLQGTTNVLGRTIREVLLMEFLAGDEVRSHRTKRLVPISTDRTRGHHRRVQRIRARRPHCVVARPAFTPLRCLHPSCSM